MGKWHLSLGSEGLFSSPSIEGKGAWAVARSSRRGKRGESPGGNNGEGEERATSRWGRDLDKSASFWEEVSFILIVSHRGNYFFFNVLGFLSFVKEGN